jgi:hypothetical protein
MLFVAAFAAACGSERQSTDDVVVDGTIDALSQDQFECERTKRECLITADCDHDKREACKEAFHACEEPVRDEKKRVHEMCREAKKTCEEAATDAAARHACHKQEDQCKLSVEPPEFQCHIDAEECLWIARGMMDPTPPTTPPTMPPTMPPAMPPMHRMESDAERACREAEHECRDAMRLDRMDLPKAPHCEPEPPACVADPMKP